MPDSSEDVRSDDEGQGEAPAHPTRSHSPMKDQTDLLTKMQASLHALKGHLQQREAAWAKQQENLIARWRKEDDERVAARMEQCTNVIIDEKVKDVAPAAAALKLVTMTPKAGDGLIKTAGLIILGIDVTAVKGHLAIKEMEVVKGNQAMEMAVWRKKVLVVTTRVAAVLQTVLVVAVIIPLAQHVVVVDLEVQYSNHLELQRNLLRA